MKIIEDIIPYYNEYKNNVNIFKPFKLIEIMWDIGEILNKEINSTGKKPHTLFREIYGKGEGKSNIVQNSYITREFLGRCLRVYKLYENKDHIKSELFNINRVTLFREAMPFLDNVKYKDKVDRNQLICTLNSHEPYKQKMEYLRLLKKKYINKKNPRTQQLDKMVEHANVFIEFYNYLYQNNSAKQKMDISQSSCDLFVIFRNTQSLSNEEYKKYEQEFIDEPKNIWDDYSNILYDLITDANAKNRRRFRKLIPISKIINLSTMIYKLISKQK